MSSELERRVAAKQASRAADPEPRLADRVYFRPRGAMGQWVTGYVLAERNHWYGRRWLVRYGVTWDGKGGWEEAQWSPRRRIVKPGAPS